MVLPIDNFGSPFEAVRKELFQVGYRQVTLANSQSGTTDAFLFIDGRTEQSLPDNVAMSDGIPVPPDSTVIVELLFSTYLDAATDAHEGGRITFGGYRRGTGNVALLDIVGAAGFENVVFAETAGDVALSVTLVVTANTTTQSLRITVDQAAGTDIAYVMGRATVVCATRGLPRPFYIQ